MTRHYDSLVVPRPAQLGGGTWTLSRLRDVSVLFGRNGCGKSLLLRQLQEQADPPTTHYASPERAGEMQFDQNILIQELEPGQRGQQRRGRNAVATYRRESVTRVSSLQTLIGNLRGHGQDVGDSTLIELEEGLRELMPTFSFEALAQQPFFQVERLNPDLSYTPVGNPSQELSSGETEALTLALDVITICQMWELEGREQRLLLIDEPDTHLHPDLQVWLARLFTWLLNRYSCQELIATHSTTMLAAIGNYAKERMSVVYMGGDSPSLIAVEHEEAFNRLAGILGGHALVAPLFGAPLLLVEGDDEYTIWSQVPRSPATRGVFAVIPCGGDEIVRHQELLEKVLASLREPGGAIAGFALLDGDKSRPTHLPEDNVRFLQLKCREAENLYLADEVLHRLGTTWESAIERIEAQAADFGEKSERLSACRTWNREEADVKDVVKVLPQILDEKTVPWAVRVGQVLGAGRPTGQLAEFLGDEVVSSLWGYPSASSDPS